MDDNYIITSDGVFVSESDLQHHGVRGMKWGIRRYQNKDGSLTAAGRKRYGDGDSDSDGKSATGRSGRDGKSTSKSTGPKGSAKPAAKKVDQDAKDKAKGDEVETKKQAEAKKSEGHEMSTLSTKDIKAINDRLQSEDNLKQLLEKRGYTVSLDEKSETDRIIESLTKEKQIKQLQNELAKHPQISDLQRQKEYMQLQIDVKDLDAKLNPKKESAVKKLMTKVVDDVVIPAATNAGKKALENWLTERGAEILKKEADKTADKLADKEKKVREAFDRENAKAAEKNAKRSAEEYAKTASSMHRSKGGERSQVNPNESRGLSRRNNSSDDTVYTSDGKIYTVSKSGSNSSNKSTGRKSNYVVDMEAWPALNSPVSSLTTRNSTSSGKSYVSGYLNSSVSSLPSPNIAGYLPAPKDDD